MGVLNVTPDSFSDGGLYDTYERAVARGLEMMAEGADVVDVGGESSRPGAEPVPADVELARVVPVVEALAHSPTAAERGVRVSVDTVEARGGRGGARRRCRPPQRHLGLAVGRGGRDAAPAGWPCTCGAGRAPCRRTRATRTWWPRSGPSSWSGRRGRARPGCARSGSTPGSASARPPAHNLSLLRHLPELVAAGAGAGCAGVLVGTSRKRFLGLLGGGDRAEPAPVVDRLEASLATAAAAMVAGVGMVRVHDVAATVQVARLYGPAA